ncbi:MAG: phage/plasmid primase, P4 family [Nitrospiraceae bacterium]|nr:phage/plasmid primase, P4 family [Nitrospiraceae bacterium]
MDNIDALSKERESPSITDELDLAESLSDDETLVYSSQRFWKFSEDEGIWFEIPDDEIRKSLQTACRCARISVRDTFIRGALNQAKARFFKQITFDRIDTRSIPTLNGVLRFSDGQWSLSPYLREDYRRVRLPITFDPTAKCPRFLQFLEEIFEPLPGTGEEGRRDALEKIRALLEFMGYSFTCSTEFETAILLVGAGGNGKSVVLRLLERMVGSRNRAAVQIRQLDNRFQRAHLDGKLVNIMSELPEGAEIPDGEIKSLISGETITAEFKFKSAFDLSPVVKLWIGTNHMPSTRDLSEGLFRRFLILQFNNRFDDKPERDTRLVDKLAAESSGILNLCLKALGGVYERGALTKPRSSVLAVEAWKRDVDQVAQFLDECMTLGAGLSMKTVDLYNTYRSWAIESGIKKLLGKKGLVQRLDKFGVKPGKVQGARGVWGIKERSEVDELVKF